MVIGHTIDTVCDCHDRYVVCWSINLSDMCTTMVYSLYYVLTLERRNVTSRPQIVEDRIWRLRNPMSNKNVNSFMNPSQLTVQNRGVCREH